MSPQKVLTATLDLSSICAGDCCEQAVKRAYREMKEQGLPDQFAFDAARKVFAWHHPEIAAVQAEGIVSLWVRSGAMH